MQGGNTPFLCGTCYTVSKTFLRVFPPPCFRAMSIWFELNMEIFGILYSDYLSNEVSDLIENALALCERRKEQKLTSLCRLQTIQEGLDLYGRRGPWHPTPVLLPGKSHWRRSLVGCSPWGREQSGTTERLHFHFSLSLFTFMHLRRKWQPTPVFLPGKSQGPGSLVGCHQWGRTSQTRLK